MTVIELNDVREKNDEIDVLVRLIDCFKRQIDELSGKDDAASLTELAKLVSKMAAARNKLDRAVAREAKRAEARKDEADEDDVEVFELRERVKEEIRAWLKENDYSYVHEYERFALYSPETQKWTYHRPNALPNHNPKLKPNSEYFSLFVDVLKEDRRWFRHATQTFGAPPPDTLNLLRYKFLEPSEGQHHWLFDTLLESVAGGERDSIEHVEKLLLAKYLHPENYLLPTLVISDEGGTGKSLLAERVLPTLFGETLVAPNVSMDEVTGQFNSQLQGKAVWFINENRADKYDHEALKRILGSRTFKTERKGIDAQYMEKIALVIVAGNFALGSVKLTGTEVDRRFSIIRNSQPLHHYTAMKLGVGGEEAKTWMINHGQHILGDKVEVAKWIASLIVKYGDIDDVAPYHADDYREMVGLQRETHEEVYALFFGHDEYTRPDPDPGYFRRGVMLDFYIDACIREGRPKMNKGRFYGEAERWAKRNGYTLSRRDVNWTVPDPMGDKRSKTTVYIHSNNPPASFASNDDAFFVYENGRKAWKISID